MFVQVCVATFGKDSEEEWEGVSVLGMFVLLWCWGMIGSEDVIGLSVCIPGFMGGVSPAYILEI